MREESSEIAFNLSSDLSYSFNLAKNSSLTSTSKSEGTKWEQRPDLSNNGREWLQFSKFFISSFDRFGVSSAILISPDSSSTS